MPAKKYQITIHDIHECAGEISDTTMTCFGQMIFSEGRYIIRYVEESGELEGFVTDIKVTEPDLVAITRKGPTTIELMLENKRRHTCLYKIPEGTLSMGVYTHEISSGMSMFGGTLDLHYDIDFDGSFVSDNKLHISVKEIF